MQLVLQHPLFRRLVPEVRKAFQFEATRTNGTWSEKGWGSSPRGNEARKASSSPPITAVGRIERSGWCLSDGRSWPKSDLWSCDRHVRR